MSSAIERRTWFGSKPKEPENEASVWDREQQRKLNNKRNEAAELALQAQAVSREKIEPYLNAVNKAVADGKGELSVPHISSGNKVAMNTTLTWWDTDDGWRKEGYKITLNLDLTKKEVSWEQNRFDTNGNKLRARLNYEAPDYEEKMKDLLKTIAVNPAYIYFLEMRPRK